MLRNTAEYIGVTWLITLRRGYKIDHQCYGASIVHPVKEGFFLH
jgi:hypothetical protein